jgi:lipid-binding SYLF domain-containing protein
MKTNKIMLITMLFISVGLFAQSKKDNKVIAAADQVKSTLIQKDAGIQKFIDNSKGYVIFPKVGKGGFIVGAASGNGVVYQNGQRIGMADVKKLDIGLQAGGKTFSEIIFFQDDTSFNRFKDDDFEFTGNVSAVMLKSGASADVQYREGVAVFVVPIAGLMVDVSVGGQKFEYTPMN